MFSLLANFITYLFFIISGPRIVNKIKKTSEDLTTLFVKSTQGFNYTLYCEKIDYLIKYKRFYMPSQIICVYRVYSVLEGDHLHKELFDEEIILPKISGLFLTETKRRQLLLEAYVDIISEKFKK